MLKIAFRNIFRSKFRTLFVGFLIAVCSCSVLWALSLADAISKEAVNIFIRQHGSVEIRSNRLSLEHSKVIEAINKTNKSQLVVPFIHLNNAEIGGKNNYSVTELVSLSEKQTTKKINIKKGRKLSFHNEKSELILNETVAKEIDAQIGDILSVTVFTSKGILNVGYFTLVGITPFHEISYLTFDSMQGLIADHEHVSGERIWTINNYVFSKQEQETISHNINCGATFFSWKDQLISPSVQSMKLLMTSLITLLLFTLFIVIGMILAQFVKMSIQDRIREIGTYIALGSSYRQIFKLITLEGLILSIFFSSIGVFIGIISCVAIRQFDIFITFGYFFQAYLLPNVTIKGILISFLFPIISVLFWSLSPILKIAGLKPMEVLTNV